MKPIRMNKRRACATPSHSKRLKNDNIETQPKDLSVPGDLDFYIDDDGNLETLEIGSIPNTPTVTSTPVRVASPLAQPNHDQYCWVCHTDETTTFCDTCIRSFHFECLRRTTERRLFTDLPENWRCPQCVELRNAKNDFHRRQVDLVKFNELLKFIVGRLYNDEDLKKFGTTFNNVLRSVPDITIINPIDLNLIDEKVTDSKYESIMEFIVDIKWIFHNCGIAFKQNKEIFPQAKRMLRFCERELYDIEICPECYLGSNTYTDKRWFVNACERPHLLVWAKLKGNQEPYWPGKAVAMKNGMVDVRFFGDHACAFVPSANVFLYSKENPNKRMAAKNQQTLDNYAEEIDEYIANLNKKFSLFKFMPSETKFEPEKIYIHLHQMLPYLYIEENFEYFRKMKDFTKRDPKQPAQLSLGYSSDGASLGLRPLSVVMHRLENGSMSNNQDEDEADVNNLAESIVNAMNIKTEPIHSRKIIDRDSDQSTVMISSSGSEMDDDRTEVTMIEVGSLQEEASNDNESQPSASNRLEDQAQGQKIAPIDNESQSSTSDHSDDQNRNSNTVRLLSMPDIDGITQSPNANERSEEPANNEPNPSMPSSSMPIIIDETNESVTHEADAIASESGIMPLNESVTNAVATNMVLDDDDDWREIKLLVAKKMKKDHRLEQQHYHEMLSAAKTKMKKIEEKTKVLEKENEHWKISLRDANSRIREDAADFKKQLDEKDETIKRLEIEYAAKIEAMKLELDDQRRNKKWCALCRKEIGALFLNSEFCSFPCMRQSWLQNANNLNQTNNNDDEINMDELN